MSGSLYKQQIVEMENNGTKHIWNNTFVVYFYDQDWPLFHLYSGWGRWSENWGSGQLGVLFIFIFLASDDTNTQTQVFWWITLCLFNLTTVFNTKENLYWCLLDAFNYVGIGDWAAWPLGVHGELRKWKGGVHGRHRASICRSAWGASRGRGKRGCGSPQPFPADMGGRVVLRRCCPVLSHFWCLRLEVRPSQDWGC